jgi:general secretion pathway protein K
MSRKTTQALRRQRARARRRKQERGVALIMVLSAIAVLTVMLAELQEDTSAELAAALADRDSVQAEYFAKSSINLSRLLIASEPTIRQAIAPLFMLMKRTPPQLPVWEFSDRLLGAFNDTESAGDFASLGGLDFSKGKNLGLKGGRFEVVIVDEDSKINVNLGASNEIAHIRLAKQLMSKMAPISLNPLFEQKDSQGNFNDRFTICSSIIDWADTDESRFNCDLTQSASGSSGVEDYGYYQYLPHPFRIKNAPYDSLEELHLIRGVTDDFWTAVVDPDPSNPKKRNFTVWGQGTVNINSANAETLYAIICSGAPQAELCNDPQQMSLFLMGVTMAKGITMGAPLFGAPQDLVRMVKGQGQIGPLLVAMGLKPVKFQSETDFMKSITTSSKLFSIYAVGVVKGYKRETRTSIHEVVDFRQAPQLGAGLTQGQPAPAGSGSAAVPSATTTTNLGGGAVPSTNPNAINAAMMPSTGGQVLYYHVE